MNAPFPLPEVRLVLCSACGSEGRVIRHFCGDDHDEGPCPVCEGTGSEIVEVEPIDMEDLASFWASVVAEMNLQPGISLGPVNPDRLSTEAWR